MLIYGWINLANNQSKHTQIMDQSESIVSDTGISISSSPRLICKKLKHSPNITTYTLVKVGLGAFPWSLPWGDHP